MKMNRVDACFVASQVGFVAVLIALLAVSAVGVASAQVVDVDYEHELADDEAIEEYNSDAVVSTNLSSVDAEFSISDRGKHVDLDSSIFEDSTSTFLTLDYNEGVPRTVRIYVPDDYFEPYDKTTVPLGQGNGHVQFEMLDNGTSVTFRVVGETRVTVSTSFIRQGVFGSISERDFLGISTTSSENTWNYVDPTRLVLSKSSVGLNHSSSKLSIQYNEGENSTTWVPVPKRDADSDVYYFSPDAANNTTRIVSMSNDAPQVRWKKSSTSVDSLEGIINDWTASWDRFQNWDPSIPFFGGDDN